MILALSKSYPRTFYSGLFVAGVVGVGFAALGVTYLNLSRNYKIYFAHRWPLIAMPFGLTTAAISMIAFSLSKCKERPTQMRERVALTAEELGDVSRQSGSVDGTAEKLKEKLTQMRERVAVAAKELRDLLKQSGANDKAVEKLKKKHKVNWGRLDQPSEKRLSAIFNDLWQMRDEELIETLQVVCSSEGLPDKIRELFLKLSLFYKQTANLPDKEDVAIKWQADRQAIISPYKEHCNLLLLNERFFEVLDCLRESSKQEQILKVLDQFPWL